MLTDQLEPLVVSHSDERLYKMVQVLLRHKTAHA